MEKWKNIGSVYEISNTGLVKNSKTQRILKTFTNNGYIVVRIKLAGKRKGYLIHRLVAEFFVLNPENKKYVNHKDGDITNNIADNLEWCTQKENIYHSKKVSKNGAVISLKKIKSLYKENPKISIEQFITLLENNVK